MEWIARSRNAYELEGPLYGTAQAWSEVVSPVQAPGVTAGNQGRNDDATSKKLDLVKKLDQLFWKFIETIGEIER